MNNGKTEHEVRSGNIWDNRFFYICTATIIGVVVFFAGVAFAGYNSYSIHIGSYKKIDNALHMASLARSKGYHSVVMEKDDPEGGGVWHRVFIGDYDTKQEAQIELSRLKKENFSDYYAVMQVSDKAVSSTQSQKIQSSQNAAVQNSSPFTLSLTSGWSVLPSVDEFRISKSTAPGGTWYIGASGTGFIGIDANYRIYEGFSIQGGVKTELFDNIDLYYFELGPKLSHHFSGNLEGYLRAAMVYGNFDWDTVPGSFDDSFGWLASSGLIYKYNNFRFGLEVSYRNIAFDYTAPMGIGVTANQKDIDFSGALLTGTIGYQF